MTKTAPHSACRRSRIRSWRSDAVLAPGPDLRPTEEAERLFSNPQEGAGPAHARLARQLRQLRVLGAGQGVGYDLARHAALARALGGAAGTVGRRRRG